MKYRLIVPAFVALLGIGTHAIAAGEDEVIHTYKQQWQGMGMGGLLGAIVGGPPGFVVGIASGALIGHQKGQAEELTEARQKVLKSAEEQYQLQLDLQAVQNEALALRKNIAQNQMNKNQQGEVLVRAGKDYAEQLTAIADGFVLNIQFRTESAALATQFKLQLTHAVVLMNAFPELIVHLNGYADQRGTNQFNHLLSQKRVDAVAQHLQAAGISVDRIRKILHGESQAKYSVDDSDGMGFDRRVVLYFGRELS